MNDCRLLSGGFPLTISGQGFASGATVTVGGAPCIVTSASVLEVICTVPAEVRDTQIFLTSVTLVDVAVYRPT